MASGVAASCAKAHRVEKASRPAVARVREFRIGVSPLLVIHCILYGIRNAIRRFESTKTFVYCRTCQCNGWTAQFARVFHYVFYIHQPDAGLTPPGCRDAAFFRQAKALASLSQGVRTSPGSPVALVEKAMESFWS